VHGDVQICPEPAVPPDNGAGPGHSDLHSSTHHTAVAIDDGHLHESSCISTQNVQSSTPQNPIPFLPQTSPTIQPSSHSKPSTIYTSCRDLPLDSSPSSSKRRGYGQVMRRYRNREHIYAKEVSYNYCKSFQATLIDKPAQSQCACSKTTGSGRNAADDVHTRAQQRYVYRLAESVLPNIIQPDDCRIFV
jgi:hypothetical protein